MSKMTGTDEASTGFELAYSPNVSETSSSEWIQMESSNQKPPVEVNGTKPEERVRFSLGALEEQDNGSLNSGSISGDSSDDELIPIKIPNKNFGAGDDDSLSSDEEEEEEEEEGEDDKEKEEEIHVLSENEEKLASLGGKAVTILSGHTRAISSVAWSPDCSMVLTGSFDGTARFWDATTGQCIKILRADAVAEKSYTIRSACWSCDGSKVATINSAGKVIIWDAIDGEVIQTMEANSINSISWSPKQPIIVTGCVNGKLHLWDVPTNQCIATYDAQKEVKSVGWSSDGAYIASGTTSVVLIWDFCTGKQSAVLTGKYAPTKSLSWSPVPGKSILALINLRRTVALWDMTLTSCIAILKHKFSVWSLTWSGDGTSIITGSRDKVLRIWNTETSRCTATFKDTNASGVNSIAWSPNNFRIATGSSDKNVYIWNAFLGERASAFDDDNFVDWMPKNEDGTPRTWVVPKSRMRRHRRSLDDNEQGKSEKEGAPLIWSLTGWTVHLDSNRTKATIRSPSSDQDAVVIEGHMGKIACMAWSSNTATATVLLTGASDGAVRVWDGSTGQCTAILQHYSRVTSVAWSPNSPLILTGCQDSSIRIWDPNSEETVASLIEPVSYTNDHVRPKVAWSRDGSVIAAATNYVRTRVWDLSTTINNNGIRLDPNFSSFPLSPLTVNDHILLGLDAARRNPRYDWPWFRNVGYNLLQFSLQSDMGRRDRRTLSIEERRCLEFRDDFSWENPVHRAVRCGDGALSLLRIFLSIMPFEAMQSRWAPSWHNVDIPEKKSLLIRALDFEALDCIKLILGVFSQFLTMPERGREEDEREFLKTRDTHLSLWVFKGNDSPYVEIECKNHCADHIDVLDICKVAEKYHDVLLDFVKTLRIVPNYDFVRAPDLSLAPMGMMNRLLAPSEVRSPGKYRDGSTRSIGGSSHRQTLQRSIFGDDLIKRISGLQTGKDKDEESNKDSFWTLEKVKRISYDIGAPFRPNERVAVSPGIIPLKNIAGLVDEGQRICPFLGDVTNAAEKFNDYSVFENEVVQSLVDFKWESYVRRKFRIDLVLFILLSVSFISNAILFEQYENGNVVAVTFGNLLTGMTALLTLYFLILEFQQILHARRDGNKSVMLYFTDGWNILDNLFLLMLTATISSQYYQMFSHHSAISIGGNKVYANVLAAASMPLLAFQALYYLKATRDTGALVRMTINIMNGIKVFCGILLLFIVTFASAFYLLFQHVDENSFDDDIAFVGAYWKPHRTLLAVFTLLLGDINVNDMYKSSSPQLAVLLLVVFLFVTGVVLMNMLIAIMGDLYDEVQDKAAAQATYAKARLILEYESRISKHEMISNQKEWFPTWIQVLKRGNFEKDSSEVTTWEGRVKAISMPLLEGMELMKLDFEKLRKSTLALDKLHKATAETEERLRNLEESSTQRLDKMEKTLETVAELVRELADKKKHSP